MDLSPEFSSPTVASSVELAELQEDASLQAATLWQLERMIDSTPILESNLVTKKVESTEDPWEDTDKVDVQAEYANRPSEREFLTVTLKAGTGYDAPWLVFHANSVAEALESLKHEDLDELMDLTARKGKELAKAFGGSAGFSKPAGTASTGFKKPTAKKPVYDEDSDTYECEHGPREWVSKKGAKGFWYAYMCPADSNDPSRCSPLWANKDGSLQNR